MASKWILLSVLGVLCAGFIVPVHASWVENGNPVSVDPAAQYVYRIVSDGAGGAIVAHWDNRNGNTDVYAQRIDRYGNTLWGSGIAVCTQEDVQHVEDIVTDETGGAIMVWIDNRAGDYDIYVQRIDGGGNVLWTPGGVEICDAINDQLLPVLAPDGEGGVFVVWEEWRTATADSSHIYAQRVDADGSALWAANGIMVSTDNPTYYAQQLNPRVTAEGYGGAVVLWQNTYGVTDPSLHRSLKCQRLDGSGNLLWNSVGESVVGSAGSTPIMKDAQIIADGTGGAFICWLSFCSSCGNNWNLWAQRMTATGTRGWLSTGNQVCYTSTYSRFFPYMAGDGQGGLIVTWRDSRNLATTGNDIYIQRADFNGNMQWTANGKVLCNETGNQQYPRIVRGESGTMITWVDWRGANPDIYMQNVDLMGDRLWQSGGLPVCVYTADQHWPNLVLNSFGGAIVAWRDQRNVNYDLYAQSINRYGEWQQPSAEIAAVEDIPDDEGGWVRIRVDASDWDDAFEQYFKITGYNVWRRVVPAALSSPVTNVTAAQVLERSAGGGLPAGLVLSAAQASLLGLPDGDWESVGYHASAQNPTQYLLAAPTRADSIDGATPWDSYVVTSHTALPMNYLVSEPDSGYSVDNLAPVAPTAFTAAVHDQGASLVLSWEESEAIDLDRYVVYRGLFFAFEPSENCRLVSPRDAGYLDPDWRGGAGYCYKVSAVDVHGNESGFASLSAEDIEGGPPPIPGSTYLAQNIPNPFNPSTTIKYGIETPSRVDLRLFDAAGHLVRVLVDADKPAGRYEENWDGRDDKGGLVSSGVYFCRLTAGSYTDTRKLTLVK